MCDVRAGVEETVDYDYVVCEVREVDKSFERLANELAEARDFMPPLAWETYTYTVCIYYIYIGICLYTGRYPRPLHLTRCQNIQVLLHATFHLSVI